MNGRLHALLHEATAAATAPLKRRMDVGSLTVPKSLLQRVYAPRVKAEGGEQQARGLEALSASSSSGGNEDKRGTVTLRELMEAGLIENVCRIEGNDCLFSSPTPVHGNGEPGHGHSGGGGGTHDLWAVVVARAEPTAAALYVRIDTGERVAEREWRECLLRN